MSHADAVRWERERCLRVIQHQRDKYEEADPIQAALDEIVGNIRDGWDPSYTEYKHSHGPLVRFAAGWRCKTCGRKGALETIAQKPCTPPNRTLKEKLEG